MEIILREDIDNLGARGQVVKVAPGYARNYLLPRRLAVAATDANRKIVEQERQAHLRKEAVLKTESEELAKLLSSATVSIARKAGENGQLFGSVTAGDIADALTAQNPFARSATTKFRFACIAKFLSKSRFPLPRKRKTPANFQSTFPVCSAAQSQPDRRVIF